MKKNPALLALACAASLAFAGTGLANPAKATQAKQAAAQPKPAAEAQKSAQAPNGGKGKVLETMDAASYTYVKVDVNGSPVWAAAPKFKVKKGDTVVVPAGAPMPGFHSKTLNRTFDMIYFVGGIQLVDAKTKK